MSTNATAYISGYGHIYKVLFDAANGRITTILQVAGSQQASCSVYSKKRSLLYTVEEVEKFEGKKDEGGLEVFDTKSEKIEKLNSVSSKGGAPAHIILDNTEKWLCAANYASGSFGVWHLADDGKIDASPIDLKTNKGSGPNKERQEGPHAHQFVFSRSNKHVYIPDLGCDKIWIYQFDEATGLLTPNPNHPFGAAPAGSGPRHICFHPTLNFAYVITELDSCVLTYRVDPATGALDQISTIAASMPDEDKTKSGAEVQITKDGKFLYTTVRYEKKNGVFGVFVVHEDGRLIHQQFTSTEGVNPRFFCLDPTERFVIATHQNTNNVVVFKRDVNSGLIDAGSAQKFEGFKAPTWVEFV